MKYHTAYIGLGSNLGDRASLLQKAIDRMAEVPDTRILAVSKIIETKPLGPVQDQPNFLNGVAALETSLEPLELMDRLLTIEKDLGRIRDKRWGPRTVDLDMLLYDDRVIDHPRLQVPHPEIRNRPFVVEALRELGAPL